MTSRSPVWKYFDIDTTDATKTICKRCSKKIGYKNGSTGSMINHLKSVHNITNLDDESQAPPSKKFKTMDNYKKKETLEEIVAKLASKDGFSIHAITKSDFIRQKISEMNYKLPKNPSDVMNLVHKHHDVIKDALKAKIKTMLEKKEKFSITLDEWTSVKMRKYLNINIHACDGTHFNLGLVRIFGSADAITLQSLVREHLASFGINFDTDVVACTSDGASVMVKFGRECPSLMQLCYNHAIHLAVLDTITEPIEITEDENAAEDDEDEENYDDEMFIYEESTTANFSSLLELKLEPLRKVIKFFRKSTVKNNILQSYVKDENGKELELLLDIRIRWNSIEPMLERAIKLKSPIKQALDDLQCNGLFEALDFEFLNELLFILTPIRLTVEALSRADCNLITAEGAIKFLNNKLEAINTDLSEKFRKNLNDRIDARRNKEVNEVITFLQSPSTQSRTLMDTSVAILRRLYPNEELTNDMEVEDIEAVPPSSPMSLEEELNKSMHDASQERVANVGFDKLKQELNLFKLTGNKTENVTLLQNALKTIRPTSTESERTFSIAGNFCTKIRSKLSDKSLNSLVFLKFHFLKQ